ncbi:MAG: hypothetical protein IPJ25_11770 [Rhodocyclaceae bacterium]|nr:hypothetical protein [Rhodocyclaceae bacterium]
MNENELERLKQLYPYQFARVIDEWGMSVEPGWMTIFSETCAAIDAALTGHRKENFSWRQVKEKIGRAADVLGLAMGGNRYQSL